MRAVLVSMWFLAACAMACESKPDLPETHNYLIRTKNLDYVGATVLVGDRRVAFRKKYWNASEHIAQAEVRLPRSGPLVGEDLKLELVTPCGAKTVPLPGLTAAKEKKDRSKKPSSDVMLDAPPGLPPSVFVWVDASGPVELGKAELQPKRRTRVFEPDCSGKEVPVTAGGKTLGTYEVPPAPAKDREHRGLLISDTPSSCYQLTLVNYSKTGASGLGSSARPLREGPVHAFSLYGDPEIRYFLEEAPSSKGSDASVYELVTAACPEG